MATEKLKITYKTQK